MKTRIMFIELKGEESTGEARIGRVQFSKTLKSIHYRGKTFKSLKGGGFKSNYYDEDIQKEYWAEIRNISEKIGPLRIN